MQSHPCGKGWKCASSQAPRWMEAAPAKFRSLCNSFARILRTCSTARVRDRESAHPNDVHDDPDRFDDHGRLVGRDRFSEATRSPKLVGVVAVAGRGLCLVQSAGPNQRPVVHRGWQRLHHSLCGALHSRSLPVSSAPYPWWVMVVPVAICIVSAGFGSTTTAPGL